MPKKTPTTTADSSGMAVLVYGDATGVGEDTLSVVNATVNVTDNGKVTKAKGKVVALAAAESETDGTAFANTATDVSAEGADKIKIKTKHITVNQDGESYDLTVTKFKVVDKANKDGPTKIIEKTKEVVDHDISLDLDGNVADLNFDVQSHATDSLVTVDAFALAVENELSVSTVMIVAASG